MVIKTKLVLDVSKEVASILIDDDKADWKKRIAETKFVQDIISRTELDSEMAKERIGMLSTDAPGLIGSEFGPSSKDWILFLRAFYGAVNVDKGSIASENHQAKCKEIGAAFEKLADMANKWTSMEVEVKCAFNGKFEEGRLGNALKWSWRVILGTVYYFALYREIEHIGLNDWPTGLKRVDTTAVEIEKGAEITSREMLKKLVGD